MLIATRVEVERGGIGDIAAGVIRNNRDIIAYLALIRRPAFPRIECGAYLDVRRPRCARICTVGVEQLRKKVARIIPCVVPHSVKPPVWRY